nr:hypothetical protein [Candidatus Sigynarchaeota archaeon]
MTSNKYVYKTKQEADAEDESVFDGFAVSAFGIILVLIATVILILATAAVAASFPLYHRWLEAVAWITGFGSTLFFFGLLFHARARLKMSSILFGIAGIVGLVLVLYVDYFRPDLGNPSIFTDA